MTTALKTKARAWTPPAIDVPLIVGGAKLWFMPVNPQPPIWQGIYDFRDGTFARVGEDYESHPFRGPFEAGESLWLREIYCDRAIYAMIAKLFKDRYHYAADGRKSGWAYRPAVCMPRQASRCSRGVTSVVSVQSSRVTHEDMFLAGFKGEMRHNKVMPVETVFRNHIGKLSKSKRDPSLLWLWRIGLEDATA